MPLAIGAFAIAATGIWAGFVAADGAKKLTYLAAILLVLYIAYKFKG